ncbi:uncharacterized protein LOC124162456 [Ischnura elegans]|uniref:uncharacterized protein LOC124162456 n=1 Tax=Ischnura elegans TaxID=197161 RepID=UPI001ED881D0|nr:uncharacterized protein LOC124162456 [Ischnura elegans]
MQSVHCLLAALALFLLSAVQLASSSSIPLTASNLRIYAPRIVLRHTPHVYPAISSPGTTYLAAAGAVKRSARILFPDAHRGFAPRSDILQALDEHVFPWTVQGTSQGLLSMQAAAEAALSRTLFFADYPHDRVLESYIAYRRETGAPDIRLGSIRFSSPFLISL